MLGFSLSTGVATKHSAGAAWSPGLLFSPGDVGEYWDYTDISSLFQDYSGTTPVSSLGDVIGYVSGQRSAAAHGQFSTSGKPIYAEDPLSVAGGDLEVSGSYKSLSTAAQLSISGGDVTIALGVYLNGNPNSIMELRGGADEILVSGSTSGGTRVQADVGGFSYNSSYIPYPGAGLATLIAWHDSASEEAGLDINGTTVTVSTAAGASFGGNYQIGGFAFGYARRAMVIDRVVSSDDRGHLATWLGGVA